MHHVARFLASPPIRTTIEEIRAALNSTATPQLYNPNQHIIHHDYHAAAVLIPIWQCPDTNQLKVLLTQRPLHMRNHPGQIAFPGGKHDPKDATMQCTALRETFEEVGLPPDCFELLGELGEYCSISGFCIKPVVAHIIRMSEPRLNKEEVESMHWVPLEHLLNPHNFHYIQHDAGNQEYGYFEVIYEGLRIWGVTAGILFGLYQIIKEYHQE